MILLAHADQRPAPDEVPILSKSGIARYRSQPVDDGPTHGPFGVPLLLAADLRRAGPRLPWPVWNLYLTDRNTREGCHARPDYDYHNILIHSFGHDELGRAHYSEADTLQLLMRHNLNNRLLQRRARGSNPQPLSGHHISSVAASHSLTLRKGSKLADLSA